MILKGFGFEENVETSQMLLKNFDKKLFEDGLALLKPHIEWTT